MLVTLHLPNTVFFPESKKLISLGILLEMLRQVIFLLENVQCSISWLGPLTLDVGELFQFFPFPEDDLNS